MTSLQWCLDLVVIGLLSVTLYHAARLERALGVLKRDRAALERLVEAFNASTREAQAGIERLRATADGAGRDLARQIETSADMRDELLALTRRAEAGADRFGRALSGRADGAAPAIGPNDDAVPEVGVPASGSRMRSRAERDLVAALRLVR